MKAKCKKCTRCGLRKSPDNFYANFKTGSICFECRNKESDKKCYEDLILENIENGLIPERFSLIDYYPLPKLEYRTDTRIEIINQQQHLIIPSQA